MLRRYYSFNVSFGAKTSCYSREVTKTLTISKITVIFHTDLDKKKKKIEIAPLVSQVYEVLRLRLERIIVLLYNIHVISSNFARVADIFFTRIDLIYFRLSKNKFREPCFRNGTGFFRKFEDEKFASTLKFISINNRRSIRKNIRFFFYVPTLNEKILKCWK